MTADADALCRELFAHPELVRDLLSGFVPYPWARSLDVGLFERVNASYVSDRGQQRHADMVWRFKLGRDWVYVYLLLEFQSRSDRWMALRMQVYVGLLYQDLVAQRKLSRFGKLPPVLPIVLYHGARPWNASTELAGLRLPAPEGLEIMQPEQRYLLIDQTRHGRLGPATRGNLVAALFALAHSRTAEHVGAVLQACAAWLKDGENESLRSSLTRWMQAMLQGEFRDDDLLADGNVKEVHTLWNQKYATIDEMMIDDVIRKYRKQIRQLGLREDDLRQSLKERLKYREEGIRLARQEVIRKLVVKRDGSYPAAIAGMVDAAKLAQLTRWMNALLDGASPEQVFGAG